MFSPSCKASGINLLPLDCALPLSALVVPLHTAEPSFLTITSMLSSSQERKARSASVKSPPFSPGSGKKTE